MGEDFEARFHAAQAVESEQNESARREEIRRRCQGVLEVDRPDGSKDRLSDVAMKNGEFTRNIAGDNIRINALESLQAYAMNASDLHRDRESRGEGLIPPAEAERAVAYLEEIRNEFTKDEPNIERVGAILTKFIAGRLKHFSATFGQRLETTVRRLVDHYAANPKEAERMKVQGRTESDWEQELRKKMGGRGGPDYQAGSLSTVLEKNQQLGFPDKPAVTMKWVDKIREQAAVLGPDSDPLSPDAYEEPEAKITA